MADIWNNITNNISNLNTTDCAISDDGLTFAIANRDTNIVNVYRRVSTTRYDWAQLGATINATYINSIFSTTFGASDLFGAGMAFSSNGNILAIGAPGWSNYRGRTFILAWDAITNNWIRSGDGTNNPLVSLETDDEYSGIAIKIYEQASNIVIAIGETAYNGNRGTVRFLWLSGNTWTLTPRADGNVAGAYLGENIAWNNNLSLLFAGASYYNYSSFIRGAVGVLRRSNWTSNWTSTDTWTVVTYIIQGTGIANTLGMNLGESGITSYFGYGICCTNESSPTLFILKRGSTAPLATRGELYTTLVTFNTGTGAVSISNSATINPLSALTGTVIIESNVSCSSNGGVLALGYPVFSSNSGCTFIMKKTSISGAWATNDANTTFVQTLNATNQSKYDTIIIPDGTTLIVCGSQVGLYTTQTTSEGVINQWITPTQFGANSSLVNQNMYANGNMLRQTNLQKNTYINMPGIINITAFLETNQLSFNSPNGTLLYEFTFTKYNSDSFILFDLYMNISNNGSAAPVYMVCNLTNTANTTTFAQRTILFYTPATSNFGTMTTVKFYFNTYDTPANAGSYKLRLFPYRSTNIGVSNMVFTVNLTTFSSNSTNGLPTSSFTIYELEGVPTISN